MPRHNRYASASPIVGSSTDGDSCGCAAKSNGQIAGRYTSPVRERLTYVPPSPYQSLSTRRPEEKEITITRTISPSRRGRSESPVTVTRTVSSPRGTLEMSKTYEVPRVSSPRRNATSPSRRETSSVPRVLSPRAGLLQTRSVDREYLKTEHVHGDHQHHLHHIEHKLQKLAVSDFTKDYPNLPEGKVVDVTDMDRDGNGTVIRDVDDLDVDTVHIPRLPKVVSASPEGVEHIEELLLRPKEVTAVAIADWSKSQASSRASSRAGSQLSSRASSAVSTRSSSLASTPSRYAARSSSPVRGPSSASMGYTPSTPTRSYSVTSSATPAARSSSPSRYVARSASPPRYQPQYNATPAYSGSQQVSVPRSASPPRAASPTRYTPSSSVPRSASPPRYSPTYTPSSSATRTGRSSSPTRYSPAAAVPSRSLGQYSNSVANALGSEL